MKNRLKILRAEHNLTQEELSLLVGVSRQTINAIEKEKYSPSLELAFKLAGVFGVNVEQVFRYEAEEEKKEVIREIPDEHKRGYR